MFLTLLGTYNIIRPAEFLHFSFPFERTLFLLRFFSSLLFLGEPAIKWLFQHSTLHKKHSNKCCRHSFAVFTAITTMEAEFPIGQFLKLKFCQNHLVFLKGRSEGDTISFITSKVVCKVFLESCMISRWLLPKVVLCQIGICKNKSYQKSYSMLFECHQIYTCYYITVMMKLNSCIIQKIDILQMIIKLETYSKMSTFLLSEFSKFYIKELKGTESHKLSGEGQIFQVWPYLNSLIICYPCLCKNMSKFSHFPCQVKYVHFPSILR